MSSWQLLLLGGILGAVGVAQISDALIQRKALDLEAAVRQRIFAREARAMLWWKLIDGLSMILLIVGILKVLGMLRLHNSNYGLPLMAIAISLYCCAAILRAWSCSHAYTSEADGSPASGSARAAALLTTLVEVLLASAVCWYVFFYIPGPKVRAPRASPVNAAPNSPAENSGAGEVQASRPAPWVSEAEALEMLKRDADYLGALARRKSVRTLDKDGQRMYLRNDIIAEKQAGLPSEEELAEDLQAVRAERQASGHAPDLSKSTKTTEPEKAP